VALLYSEDGLSLADGPKKPNIAFNPDIMRAVLRRLYNTGRVTPQMLTTPECKALINETYKVLNGAIGQSILEETPAELTHALQHNAFIFSGFKAYHTLREVGLSLTDDEGKLKPFAKFAEDVKGVDAKYNQRYLYAEYNHAVHTSQMAVKWNDFTKDGDEYNLQYRTAGDERVRSDHARLDGVTLPPSDKFWTKYLPPNGWNCRCQVVQVLKEDYAVSDSDAATAWGDDCTADPKAQIFRYNAGKEMEIFPPKHPYFKAPESVKKVVEQLAEESVEDSGKRIKEMVGEMPEYLSKEEKEAIAKNIIEIEKSLSIKKGKVMTVEQADKQSANPKYVPEYIPDPKGKYIIDGVVSSRNPNFVKSRDIPYHINCQTCAPAYMLRLRGLKVSAKGNTSGSKSEYLSSGMRTWEKWLNPDGTQAKHTSLVDWMKGKEYKEMTPKRYKEFFDEVCKEEGVYELSIGWKRGYGHATILQRFKDGELRYIEPQRDNSEGSGRESRNVDYLCQNGARIGTRIHACRGIMRIDNKIINPKYMDIFEGET